MREAGGGKGEKWWGTRRWATREGNEEVGGCRKGWRGWRTGWGNREVERERAHQVMKDCIPQLCLWSSSLMSPQSLSPSQIQDEAIHLPSSQRNWSVLQVLTSVAAETNCTTFNCRYNRTKLWLTCIYPSIFYLLVPEHGCKAAGA